MPQRIAAIDVIRGYCLVNIYINHITAGALNRFSPSNFGLSDSADLFVFLSGVSTFLAFGRLDWRDGARALWMRAIKLYGYNVLLIVCTLAALSALAWLAGSPPLLNASQLQALTDVPWPLAVWHVLTLQQSVGFSNVLRLYIGLMAIAPLFLWLSNQRWWWALPPAILAWIIAGHLRWVGYDSLTGAPLALNVPSWTLTFVCGMVLPAAMIQNVRLRRSRLLVAASLALVVGYFAVLHAQPYWPQAKSWVETRDASFWLGGSKSVVSPLRLLHLLALVYLFTALPDAPVIRLVHQAGPKAFLAVLGRRSLPVFVTGAVLSAVANELLNLANLRWGRGSLSAILIEALLVAGGIASFWVVARARWADRRLLGRPASTAGLAMLNR